MNPSVRRSKAFLRVLLVAAATSFVSAARAEPLDDEFWEDLEKEPELSGIWDFRTTNFGTGLTECPQAGIPRDWPRPLDGRDKDVIERISEGGDDIRLNLDYSCFAQDETSIAINPLNPNNVVGGANDYRLGWGNSGFYATSDLGHSWYGDIKPSPTPNNGDDHIDGGGDPAVVFDREGVVYYAEIHFDRLSDTNGVFVSRSTNGGFTWTRPCVPNNPPNTPPTDANSFCGGNGDPRQPGDGVVAFNNDNDGVANGSVPIHDKEYIGAGPRPAGVTPVCFAPISKTPIPAGSPGCPNSIVGVDRLYVTWTIFFGPTANINVSYSDDRARSWSAPQVISLSAPFCVGGRTAGACDANQYSTPTVNPTTGFVYVGYENFNTPDENQYLVSRSKNGGQTWEGPFFVSPVFDVNYPRGSRGRIDCIARGQASGRNVLTNSCFRVNSGGNLVVDKRGGAFADDLYLVFSDNRNGTRASSNTDVFLFKSTDGGTTWVGPTRVNNDRSSQPANRACAPVSACPAVDTGNDQWFPWVDIGPHGDVNVVFMDRRLDTDSTASEWPTSRTRPGNYLTWFWGALCRVTRPDSRECTAGSATLITQPTAAINPTNDPLPEQSDFPFRNFVLSDVPSNHDYSFRAGLFIGDYNNVAIGKDNQAWAFWTDARNGRSSRSQAGRNPACEQSDVWAQRYDARQGDRFGRAQRTDELFLVAQCPAGTRDRTNRDDD